MASSCPTILPRRPSSKASASWPVFNGSNVVDRISFSFLESVSCNRSAIELCGAQTLKSRMCSSISSCANEPQTGTALRGGALSKCCHEQFRQMLQPRLAFRAASDVPLLPQKVRSFVESRRTRTSSQVMNGGADGVLLLFVSVSNVIRYARITRGPEQMKWAKPHQKPRLGPIVFSALMVLLCPPPVRALDPSLDITQYAHLAWTFRNGFSNGAVYAIAQTADGYLWLGTSSGVV